MRYALLVLAIVAASAAVSVEAWAEDVREAVPAPVVNSGSQTRFVRNAPCCYAQDGPCGSCCWKGSISIVLWDPAMEGHMAVRGRRVDIDASALDLVDALVDHGEGYFVGVARLYHGRWGVRISGAYVRLADGIEFREGGARGIDAEFGMDIIQADVGYCLGKCDVGNACGCPQTIAYEVFAGFRYFNVQGSIEPRGLLPGRSGNRDFFDPIIGARATWDLANKWSFDLEADIGGFGAGSDFTWSVRLGARYRVAKWFSAELGMKMLDIDYSAGTGLNRFEWDVLMYGPYLSFNFHF